MIEPVRIDVTLAVPRAHAFAVFADRFDTWWPRSHHLGEVALKEVLLEPREGGRWYEIREDGSELDWGYVIAWEPPARLVLAWQLNADFDHDPDVVTEVELTFAELGPFSTRVTLEHRNLERYGDRAEQTRKALGSENGWQGILRDYATVAQA